jgi:stage II sporulation SpoE-like protein
MSSAQDSERDIDVAAGRAVAQLLAGSHLLPPGDVAGALVAAARPLGVSAACIYLSDLRQHELRPMPGGASREPLDIGSTLAGRVYRTVSPQHRPVPGGDGHEVWLPLIDGTERLGVLELITAGVTEPVLARYRMLASLAGLMVVSKSGYSDTYAQTRRSREMTLRAELVWGFLPPRTFATDRMLITATTEPAYEVGGDAYDYSLGGDQMYVSIFDAAGHDLSAGLLASVGMASCRCTRRAGGGLRDMSARADAAIAGQFGGNRFVTALLCELDLASGQFSWIACGHPPPLLLRRDKVVKELARRPRLPLGMPEPSSASGAAADDTDGTVHTERLEPHDRVLLYTDGITEARAADGTPFGVERLSDFINRHSDAGTPAPETLRRLNHALTEYQQGQLADDATIVLLEWMPDHPERTLTPY